MGYTEINLISQDTTAYGRDLANGTDLPSLLRELGRIGGDFWIRILYGYPSHVTDNLLEAMGDVSQVCNYLDIPVQHSHPDILRGMKRAGTIDAVSNMGAHIRNFLPDVTLRTTCLLGFPGETDDHFKHLVDYINSTRFDHLGAFVFSPEEGTAALDMPHRPDVETAEERRGRLLEAQMRIVDKTSSTLAGSEQELLLEQPDPEDESTWIGRTRRFAPEVDGQVFVEGVKNGRPGALIRVRYTCQRDYYMDAEFVSR